MIMHDRTYTLLQVLALALGAAVACGAAWTATMITRGRWMARRWRTSAIIGLAVSGYAVCIPAFVFAVCGGPAPGQSDAAQAVRAAATPIIGALVQYASDHNGRYPAALDQLVPRYVAADVLPLRPAEPGRSVEYRADSTGYTLLFGYVGPGMNNCEYRSARGKWHCSGFY